MLEPPILGGSLFIHVVETDSFVFAFAKAVEVELTDEGGEVVVLEEHGDDGRGEGVNVFDDEGETVL